MILACSSNLEWRLGVKQSSRKVRPWNVLGYLAQFTLLEEVTMVN
jgi:hypothetical protein